MKSLLKYLSPFAPDMAGAVSVLFELEGLIAICDAGGCTGNICGFDEPRWFTRKSALFSAGLRDMDAIMGRDRQLADKLIAAANNGKFNFMAMIGSPVPAVIGTDFAALKRMCSQRLDMDILAVECSGTLYYESGASAAYCELFRQAAKEKLPVKADTIGVLGATVLDCSSINVGKLIADKLEGDVQIYGMSSDFQAIRRASEVEKNIVIAPSGLKCAKYLERKFGTPWEIADLSLPETTVQAALAAGGRKCLIVHQAFAAAGLKKQLLASDDKMDIFCGSFFNKCSNISDFKFESESDFYDCIEQGNFDLVIADSALQRPVQKIYRGKWVDFMHFAVSGRLQEELYQAV